MRNSLRVVPVLMLFALLSLGLTGSLYADLGAEGECPEGFTSKVVITGEGGDRNNNGVVCEKVIPQATWLKIVIDDRAR